MRIIRFDCVGGASGDMILGALAELGADLHQIERSLHSLIPDPFHFESEIKTSHALSGRMLTVSLEVAESSKDYGENGEKIPVCHHNHDLDHHHHREEGKETDGNPANHSHHHHHSHSHRNFAEIKRMIQESDLPDEVKKDSIAIFFTLAEAEGEIHSKKPEEVNFHEVGATDSIIDIVGSVLAFRQLNVQGVLLSPIPTGSGQVECAHGVYPIPAPATASLLRKFRLPVSLDGEECEMLTPTGAVLLGFWRANYPVIGPLSDGVMIKTGHSLGHQEMKNRPNLLRVTLWETSTESETLGENDQKSEELIEMEANLDDVSGEILGAAVTELFRLGALDVWLTPILMKKGRPGHLLGVLVPPSKRQETLTAIFRLTGTFGVRESRVLRHALARRWETVETKSGPIRIKIGSFDGTDLHFAPEFDDASAASMKTGRPLPEIYREALAVFQRKNAKEVVDE